MESLGPGDSGTTVVEMDTSGYKTKRHHIGGTSANVHLYHNSSPYNLFNLIMSEEFRSSILQEFTIVISATEGEGSKGDQNRTKYPDLPPFTCE